MRRRRTLPRCPSKARISPTKPGADPGVIAVETGALTREELVNEIRALEGELEYTYQRSVQFEADAERMREAAEGADGSPEGGESWADQATHAAAPGAAQQPLPDRQVPLAEAVELAQAGCIAVVLDGRIEATVPDAAEFVAVAAAASERQSRTEGDTTAALGRLQAENTYLRDALDEAQGALTAARDKASDLREELAEARAAAPDRTAGTGGEGAGESLGESLGDILGGGRFDPAAEQARQQEIDAAVRDGQRAARAEERRRAEAAAVELERQHAQRIAELEAELGKLEATLAANREVMGMTIEEQVVLLEGQVQLKIELDESNDARVEAEGQAKKLSWELSSLQRSAAARDAIVVSRLERPFSRKERLELLQTLKKTQLSGGMPLDATPTKSAAGDRPPTSGGRIARFKSLVRSAAASARTGASTPPAAAAERRGSRTAPQPTPFPKEMLDALPAAQAPRDYRELWRATITNVMMLNKIEAMNKSFG